MVKYKVIHSKLVKNPLDLEKAEEPEIKLPTSAGMTKWKKQNFKENDFNG